VIVYYAIEAERDLEGAAVYSLNGWGPEHRDRYMGMLQATCEQVLPEHYKQLATPYPKYPGDPNVLRYRADLYVIYFRVMPDGLEILTVRHVKREPP